MLHGFDFLRQQYSQLAKPGAQQSAVATIQTLAERLTNAVQTQAPLEDRRAAVLALKGLSRDHTRAVGEKGLPALLISLQRDAKDEELARALIECCIALCEVPAPGTEPSHPRKKQHEAGPPVGLLNTDIFLSQPEPLHALLPLLAPNRAFYTRFASLQLLGALLRNRPTRVQDHVLVAPGGCGAILECLAEGAGSSAEIVRNEALLLLPHLVHGNADIQKLVAFEGAFEKLLDVCAVEGRIEGGVIVQDALEGLESLLRYNVSNQNYFRETLSIPMLAPLLFYPPPPQAGANDPYVEQEHARQLEAFSFQEWDQQKLINAKLVVGIAGMLVGGQGEGRRANQNALLQCGLTRCLLELSLASTAPGSLKTQALHVLTLLLKASRANQDQLSSLTISPVQMILPEEPSQDGEASDRPSAQLALPAEPTFTRLPPRSAVLALIGTAVNGSGSKGGLGLRAAALALFEAYVADNMDARLSIIGTMAPDGDSNDASPFTAGTLLLDGLTQNPSTQSSPQSGDAYKYLFSSMFMAHLVRGSETAKKLTRQVAITPQGAAVRRNRKEEDGDKADDEEEDDDDESSLIQVIVGNLTMAERELADAVRRERSGPSSAASASSHFSAADWTRIMTGYLVLLSTWLFDSPLSVRDLLSESATLQALIQPVAQSSGVDPLIQGLAAFLLGVAYEFDTNPGNVAVTRATMHPILHSRIGADQFAVRLERLRDDSRFYEVGPDVLEKLARLEEDREADELRAKEQAEAAAAAAAAAAAPAQPGAPDAKPVDKQKEDEEARDREMEVSGMGHLSRRRKMGLWFDWSFVELWKNNSVLIQKTILVDPASSSATQAAASTELLDAQRQLESAKDSLAKQSREIEVLEKKLQEIKQDAEKERADLTSRLQSAEAAHTEAGPRITALEAEIASLKQSHSESSTQLSERSTTLETQLEEAQQREKASTAKVDELTKALEEAKTQAADASAVVVPVSAGGDSEALEAAKKEAEQLNKQVDELKEKVATLEKQIEADKATGQTEAAEAKKAAEALQARVAELEEEKKALTKQVEEQKAESDKTVKSLREEMQKAEQESKAANEQADKAKAESEKAKSAALAAAEKEKKDALAAAEKDKAEALAAAEKSKAEAIAAAEKKASNPKKGGAGNNKQLEELKKQLEQLTKDKEEAVKEKDDMSKENEDLLVLLEELSQKRKKDKARMKEKDLDVSEDEDDDDEDEEDA